MGVGTSLGKTFDDLFHFHQNQYDPEKFPSHDEEKSDIQKSVDNAVKGVSVEDDPDLIRNPIEVSPVDNSGRDIMGVKEMQMNDSSGKDPGNIYSDSGDIVDYKEGGQWGVPDLPATRSLIQPLSRMEFNEIDAQAKPSYDSQLTPEQQDAYSKKFGPNDSLDYDMQGYFKANPDLEHKEGAHFPDTFKKPNHPTFSDESIYHGQDGNEGGHWGTADGKDTFTPGATNLKSHTPEELKDYFNKVEPDVQLLMPK